jgi:hypothetical protein
MATSLEITNSILTSINTALQKPDLSVDDRASIINQFEQITDMIRDGYQFSDSDLLNLPEYIKDQVLGLLLSSRNKRNVSIGNGEYHDDFFCYLTFDSEAFVHFKTNISIEPNRFHLLELKGYSIQGASVAIIDSTFGFRSNVGSIIRVAELHKGQGSIFCYGSNDGYLVYVFHSSLLFSSLCLSFKYSQFLGISPSVFSIDEFVASENADPIY